MVSLFVNLIGALRSALRTRADLAPRTLRTTTNPELTYLWARTPPSREPSSRQAWARSWSYRKWVACITATSAARPDRDKCPPC